MGTKSDIGHLNSFLRGELAAVQTYRMALEKIDRRGPAWNTLEPCLLSHQRRVELLRAEIARLGGNPSDTSGPWGAFAQTVEGGARAFGDKAAIAALEEGEDHGLADYKRDLKDLSQGERQFVETELLPLQEQTHRALSGLKHAIN
jgi:hypothetical protein